MQNYDNVTTTLKLTFNDKVSSARQTTDVNQVGDVLVFETMDTALASAPDEVFWVEWQPYREEIEVFPAQKYQVWFRDAAGNVSDVTTLDGPVSAATGSNVYLPLIVK